MSITNPFPPFILHTKFNSLLLCFAPVRANSMRSLSVWEFFFLSLSPSRMLILHFFPFICAVFSAISVLFVGLYNLNILLVETSAFECCRTVIRIMQNAFEPLQKTISMISFCSVRRELKHDSFEPFFSAHFAANWNLFQGLWQFWVSNSYLYSGKKSTPEHKQKRLINTAGEIQRMENSMFAQLPIKLLKSNELMKNKRIRNQSIDQKSVMLKLR